MTTENAIKVMLGQFPTLHRSREVLSSQEVFNHLKLAESCLEQARNLLEKKRSSDPVSEAAKKGFEKG